MAILTLISLVTNNTCPAKWVVVVLATNFIICHGLLEREFYPSSGWECPLILNQLSFNSLDLLYVLIYIMHAYIYTMHV